MKNSKIITLLSTQKIILIGCGDKDDWKMQRKFFRLITLIYLPFLSVNTKSSNRWSSELKPITAFMKHQCRIFIVVIFRRSCFQLLLNELFFIVIILRGRCMDRKCWFKRVGLNYVEWLWVFCYTIVMIIIIFYQFIQWFILLSTA